MSRLLLSVSFLLLASPAMAQQTLVLATATPGGGFPVYGAAFAEMVMAQEPKLRIATRSTRGSTETVPLLEAGQVDIGLVAGDYAAGALAKPGTRVRIVTA